MSIKLIDFSTKSKDVQSEIINSREKINANLEFCTYHICFFNLQPMPEVLSS